VFTTCRAAAAVPGYRYDSPLPMVAESQALSYLRAMLRAALVEARTECVPLLDDLAQVATRLSVRVMVVAIVIVEFVRV
jgi:hypothetical protein